MSFILKVSDHDESDSQIEYGDRVMWLYSPEDIRPLFVIVEGWKHKDSGRVKRAYLAEFSKKERAAIAKQKGRLYRWYLVTGIPHKGVYMGIQTFTLLQRAALFFASV